MLAGRAAHVFFTSLCARTKVSVSVCVFFFCAMDLLLFLLLFLLAFVSLICGFLCNLTFDVLVSICPDSLRQRLGLRLRPSCRNCNDCLHWVWSRAGSPLRQRQHVPRTMLLALRAEREGYRVRVRGRVDATHQNQSAEPFVIHIRHDCSAAN